MEKYLTIKFDDLRFVTIECSNCGTKITIDMSRRECAIPGRCPACGVNFDGTSVQTPLYQYKDVFSLLTKISHKVTVQIPLKPDAEQP